MKVYCEVDCPIERGGRIQTCRSFVVTMEFPAIVPVGSEVYLPTPWRWVGISGHVCGTVHEWSVIGSVLWCRIRDTDKWGDDEFEYYLSACGATETSGFYHAEALVELDKLVRGNGHED